MYQLLWLSPDCGKLGEIKMSKRNKTLHGTKSNSELVIQKKVHTKVRDRGERRPLLGPSPGWKRLLLLSHLRHYYDTMLNGHWPPPHGPSRGLLRDCEIFPSFEVRPELPRSFHWWLQNVYSIEGSMYGLREDYHYFLVMPRGISHVWNTNAGPRINTKYKWHL